MDKQKVKEMEPNITFDLSSQDNTTQTKTNSKFQSRPSTKRLIVHITQADKNRFDRIKKDYLFNSGNYSTAGSNAGFFSYCLELLVSDEQSKQLPEQYTSFIGRRGKRSTKNSETRNLAMQLNLEYASYIKYITLIYFSTGGSPDISTAQFFSKFLDLVENLKLS
ncbi:MAG: hypothetical protein OXC92_06430 [Flavobacteriaceae bacterium]|nr:hypothetical protein [Flavobacteriaceae bacterium]MCY4216601.1 hypothetical protein [Flavobacteriaceae bacterium]MCY4253508.1 hypothetical protein [Flavobacteriaceae bacterium]